MTQAAATGRDDERITPEARRAVMAAFLGWTMDAFDYFLVVLVYADIADRVRRLADPDGVPDHGHPDHAPDRRRDLRDRGPTRSGARRC